MGFLPRVLEKELGVKALAHQPALHVDLGGDDGVDLAGRDRLLQFIECQLARHLDPCRFWLWGVVYFATVPRGVNPGVKRGHSPE